MTRPGVLDKNPRAPWKGQRLRGRSWVPTTEMWMVSGYFRSYCFYLSATEDFGLQTSVNSFSGKELVMAALWNFCMRPWSSFSEEVLCSFQKFSIYGGNDKMQRSFESGLSARTFKCSSDCFKKEWSREGRQLLELVHDAFFPLNFHCSHIRIWDGSHLQKAYPKYHLVFRWGGWSGHLIS